MPRKQNQGERKIVRRRIVRKVNSSAPRSRISGRGAYKMDPEDTYGRQWGGYLGSKLGELAGGAIHQGIKSLTGLGAYNVRSNIFLEGDLPEIHNVSDGAGNVIRYNEYLGDIITSPTIGAFETESFDINSGNRKTFPFLSQVGMQYEQYAVEGMVFYFKSTSADALNSANTALGSVMMATQYDTADALFQSKAEMLNYEYSTSCKPSEDMFHMIECAPRQTTISELYSLAGSVPEGTDSRLYHLGRLTVASVGFQAASVNIGQLHVTYQIRLLKPKLFTSLGLSNSYFSYQTGDATVNTYSNAAPLGLSTLLGFNNIPPLSVLVHYNNAGITIDRVNHYINFPEESSNIHYRIVVTWIGAGAVAPTFPALTYVNCSQTSLLTINTGVAGSTACEMQIGLAITPNSLPPRLEFDINGTLPTGNNEVQLRINMNPVDVGNQ